MAMVEFLEYWWHNILIGWRFGYRVFSYIAGICLLVSTGLFLYKKHYQHKWEKWKQIIMKTAFYLFITSSIVATVFIAPFLRYRQNSTIPINTKQEIRTLLESVKPLILQKIDMGQKDILIMINIPTEVKLLDLSQRPDFNKFLSIKQSRGSKIEDYIIDSNDISWKASYHLYPKDALIK